MKNINIHCQQNEQSNSRQRLRQQIREKRQALTPQQQQLAAQSLCRNIAKHPALSSAQHIAIFRSFDAEINTQPTIEYLWQQGKQIYLPVFHPFSKRHLLFLRYTPQTVMKTNSFGISQPVLDVRHVIPFSQLDIVFTPLVAFDERGYRLGMGGGYYDRMLVNYQAKNIIPIGIAHRCQKVPKVPEQPWDIPLLDIITD